MYIWRVEIIGHTDAVQVKLMSVITEEGCSRRRKCVSRQEEKEE